MGETKDKERESGSRPVGHREETVDRPDNRDRNRLSASERDPSRGSAQTTIKDLSRKDTSSGNKNPIAKHNLVSKLSGKLKTDSPLIDPNWENWDEDNLDYDDELMLEKKRQLLQRELEKQMAVDGGAAVSLDISAIAPGSSAKSLKATLLPTQVQPGIIQANQVPASKTGTKRSLGDKSSTSSSSSSSSSDSGSSSGSSSSSESSDDSDGGQRQGVQKKKTKTASSAKKSTGSKIGGASGLKSLGAASSSITASRHRDRSNRGSSASSGDNKRKRKDRTGKTRKAGAKKSRTSIGGS